MQNPLFTESEQEDLPLVSCIMPTCNRRTFVPRAIEYFLRQNYPNRELIIVDDGTDKVKDLVPCDSRILYLQLDRKCTIGAKRNLACEEANGEILVHWDDDDWIAPWRLEYQVKILQREEADICGLNRLFFYNPVSDQAWEYIYPGRGRPWLSGGTFCYTRTFWEKKPFPDINAGESTRFIWTNRPRKMIVMQDNTFYVALIHRGNTSPRQITVNRWHAQPNRLIRDLMDEDHSFYTNLFDDQKISGGVNGRKS